MLGQLQELLCNGYWAFECLTVRDYNDMICGICGVAPTVEMAQRSEETVLALKSMEVSAGQPPHCGRLTCSLLLVATFLPAVPRGSLAKARQVACPCSQYLLRLSSWFANYVWPQRALDFQDRQVGSWNSIQVFHLNGRGPSP